MNKKELTLINVFKKNFFTLGIILTLSVNILFLLNIVNSDYFGDDLYMFHLNGLVPYQYESIFEYAYKTVLGWAGSGRFFPGSLVSQIYIVSIFDTIISYKLFCVFSILISLLLFAYLIFLITKDKYLILFFLLIIPIFFQYKYYHDPFLAYHGLMQILLSQTTLALIFLVKFLNNKRVYFYILSVFFYFFSLITYEISFAFILLYIVVIFYINKIEDFKENLKRTIKLILPYFITLMIVVGISVYLRAITQAPIEQSPYKATMDLSIVLFTYIKQVTSTIPTTYFFLHGDLDHVGRYVRGISALVVVLFLVTYFLIAKKNVNEKQESQPYNKLLILLGLLFLLLPGSIISLSPKFQGGMGVENMVKWGVGYIPVYIQAFGLALLFALLLRKITSFKYQIPLVFVFSIVIYLTVASNNQVIKKVNTPYKDVREVFTELYKGEFGKELQNKSIIQYEKHIPIHMPSFIGMMANKEVKVVVAPDENYDYKIRYKIDKNEAEVSIIEPKASKHTIIKYKKENKLWSQSFKNTKIDPIELFFESFYGWEGEIGKFRWASTSPKLILNNMSQNIEKRLISFNMGSLIERNITIMFNEKIIDEIKLQKGQSNKIFKYELLLRSGKNTLSFSSPEGTTKPSKVDRRDLLFSLSNFKIE